MSAPTSYANLTLCTQADMRGIVSDLNLALNLGSVDAALPGKIQTKIDWVKSWDVRQEIIIIAQKAYPKTVEELIRTSRNLYQESKDRFEADERIAGTHFLTEDNANNLQALPRLTYMSVRLTTPMLYWNSGTPTSGLLNDTAESGSFLIDVVNWLPYINRGTKAVTAWSLFVVEDLVNYIYNPVEITPYAACLALLACLQDGAVRDKVGYERNLEYLAHAIDLIEHKGEVYLKKLKQVLRFDINGDGKLSNFEQVSSVKTGRWWW